MKKSASIFCLFLFVLSLISFNTNVFAGQKQISLNGVVEQVKKTTGGKVLSAKEENKGGERFYIIKVLDNGRVRIIRIDANTGKQY